MNRLQGTGVSGGIAAGPLAVYRRNRPHIEKHSISDIPAEQQIFERARREAVQQLEEESQTGPEELLTAHRMMLEDPDFTETVCGIIGQENVCAVYAVSKAGRQFAGRFAEMDDPYMQARAADVQDITERVIACLTGIKTGNLQFDTPVLLAAEDLVPSETAQLDRTKILGLVMSGGSPQGHTAILARTMGIPAVIGVGDAAWKDGVFAMIDGDTGEVVLAPDDETRGRLEAKQYKFTFFNLRKENKAFFAL